MKLAVGIGFLMALTAPTAATAASLIGNTVTCGGDWDCFNQAAVVGSGAEFTTPSFSFDFTGDTLTMSYLQSGGGFANIYYTFTDTNKPFAQADITSSSGVTGVLANDVTLTSSGSLLISLGGPTRTAGFASGSSLTISLLPSVPEVSTWAMLVGGFGLTGAALRRRRRPSSQMQIG